LSPVRGSEGILPHRIGEIIEVVGNGIIERKIYPKARGFVVRLLDPAWSS